MICVTVMATPLASVVVISDVKVAGWVVTTDPRASVVVMSTALASVVSLAMLETEREELAGTVTMLIGQDHSIEHWCTHRVDDSGTDAD